MKKRIVCILGFNSFTVQLKAQDLSANTSDIVGFNSFTVQLKVYYELLCAMMFIGFNSFTVQLKAYSTSGGSGTSVVFQFIYCAIKRFVRQMKNSSI